MWGLVASYICMFLNFSNGQNTYVNPVMYGDRPDPGALRLPDGSGFIATTTSSGSATRGQKPVFPIYFSKDLVSWTPKGHIFHKDSWPKWGYNHAWAPEIHFVNGKYNAYFTMRQSKNKILAIGVGHSTNPFGPYHDIGEPLVTHSSRGSIDATWFQDPK